jgi:sorting nexin-29
MTTLSKDKKGRSLSGNEIILGRWVEYFHEFFNAKVSDQSEDTGIMESHVDREIVEPPPTIAEVVAAIEKLKNNKAPGMDFIQAELVKHSGIEYIKYLYQLIVTIWINEIITEEWNLNIICPIHKTCSNYREISLLCTTYKTSSNILFKRLARYVEDVIGDYQCGFRQGRSTSDQIFNLRQMFEKCNECGTETHHIFTDFRAAYDSTGRSYLYIAMKEFCLILYI